MSLDNKTNKNVSKNNTVKNLPLLENFLLSGISATISKTIAAPIERVKLLLQTQTILNDLVKKYSGTFDCLIRVYKDQGLKSFWRGNMANLIRYVPNFALSYSFKEYFKKNLIVYYNKKDKYKNKNQINIKKHTYYINILSGSLAGVSSILITYPLDLARTVMAVDVNKNSNKKYKGIFDCISKCYKIEGLKGLYAGIIPNVFANFIYRGLLFGLHDSNIKSNNILINIYNTFVTSSFAIIITMPIDTIKRRLMIQSTKTTKDYIGSIDLIVKVYNKEGFKGFFKGSFANVIKSIGTSVTLVFNDILLQYYINNYK